MISGLRSFEEVVEAIKDETGISNMRNLYERIIRFLFRAEQQIGFGGSVVLKKAIYRKDVNFNGKYLVLPDDFQEYEGVGDCSGPFCDASVTSQGIRLKEEKEKAVLLYWGIYCDGKGFPVTTSNHFEAVVAFCVYKLYQQKIFLGIGNMNAKKDYEFAWEDLRDASRGNDAWPTTEQFTDIGFLTYQNRRELIMFPTMGYDYCDETINQICLPETNNPIVNGITVYFWQNNSLSDTYAQIISAFEQNKETFFDGKDNLPLMMFEEGHIVNYGTVGKICFALRVTDNLNWQLLDALNNDITDLFQEHYDVETQTVFFISLTNYSHSSIYFKFKKLSSSTIPVEPIQNKIFSLIFNQTFG